MSPHEKSAVPAWWDERPMASLVQCMAQAQQPQGTVPDSWMAGLKECVRSGYLDWPDSVIPLNCPSYLRKVAPTVMAARGNRGFFGFGVFVAWCSDLRRGAIADFPDVDTRADPDPEVTMLARCLDVAMTAPSWSRYTSPRLGRVLAERVSGRLVSSRARRRRRRDRHHHCERAFGVRDLRGADGVRARTHRRTHPRWPCGGPGERSPGRTAAQDGSRDASNGDERHGFARDQRAGPRASARDHHDDAVHVRQR